MKNGGGHFAPKLGGHFELESGGHFKLELGGQYHWNLHSTKKHNSVNRHPELVEGPSRTVRLFLSTYTQSKKQTLKTHKNHSQAIIT